MSVLSNVTPIYLTNSTPIELEHEIGRVIFKLKYQSYHVFNEDFPSLWRLHEVLKEHNSKGGD